MAHRDIGLVVLLGLLGAPGRAADDASVAAPTIELPFGTSVQIHGFVSQGYIRSTANNYLVKSRRGSFEFSEAGLNFTTQLSDAMRVGMQLFTRDLGPLGNYALRLDWATLDYRFANWLGIRAGRVKLPFGLYNDTSDADAARVQVLLPQSVYPTRNRDFLLAVTGGELYGYVDLGAVGALDYRAYGGTFFLSASESSSSAYEIREIDAPYIVGGRLFWSTPLDGLRLGGSVQVLRLDVDFSLDARGLAAMQAAGTAPPTFDGRFATRIPALLWVASIEYASGDLLCAAEYSQWPVQSTSRPALIPPTDTTSERAYVLASYRFTDWLHPGVYYALQLPDLRYRTGAKHVQHDVALTLRFDLTSFWLLKLEGHVMNGVVGLTAAENPRPQRDWLLFLAKTTAYF